MHHHHDTELLAQRLLSGALSGAFSVGMVLALASLSGAGGHKAERRNLLVAIDLTQSGEDASAASEPVEPPASQPPAPSPRQAMAEPLQPKLQLGREPAPPQPSADRPPDLALPAADTGLMTKPVFVAQAAPSALVKSPSAEPSHASNAHPARSAAQGSPGAGYKGEVWRHLQRFRRSNVIGPGSAFVSFTVGGGGHVDALGIARSSGSKRFDGEALQMVRRAQPFPAPPPAESSAFIFEIKGG